MVQMKRVFVATALAGMSVAVSAQGIFTCTTSSGRKITSDRPVAECANQDQKELNSSGTVRRIVKPAMTAEEQRIADAKAKQQAEERARQDEERRKDRALLARYPSKPAHDGERSKALAQVDEVIKAAQKRIGELADQRQLIDAELEFYKKDPNKAPASLKRQIEDNERSVDVQKRFIGEQGDEKKRVNARFDEELTRLRTLWAQAAAPTSARLPPAAPTQ